jgi:serine/threonine protein kinase/tetratricopeptide (TPR) repeat protein
VPGSRNDPISLTTSGPPWDDASPELSRLRTQFEADWRRSPGSRPDPRIYLPADPRRRRSFLLTLLRADLSLRWAAHEACSMEWYRDQFPELDGEALVALLYEEYCLREERGESPQAAEYSARFPEVAASFREVIEIHEVIGHARPPLSLSSASPQANGSLPEVGQTIAGFRLVEELGRGAFGRVYRAEERQLADRPVALKVTRTGSREPQMLARLQHTHIVPVHSYRTDPATGLHLLCMPFLGRVTLAQVLADPAIVSARSGADVLALVGGLQVSESVVPNQTVLGSTFTRRTYYQVVAWWGARLADALQHAHDRGVLHRDIKPSNVLVTSDGLPMLLDFNLAQEPWIDHQNDPPAALGGTLAYMAPEHLEALAEGFDDRVDTRSDLYALGVVLFDCLVRGTRSFALPSGSRTVAEALLRTAEARRDTTPRLRQTHPEVPAALEAVVLCCLAPNPDDRYTSAAELAADLQAVADDEPLRYAREPIVSRSVRWVRRNRRRLAVVVPLMLALTGSAFLLASEEWARLRLETEVRYRINEGMHAVSDGQLDLAVVHFDTAARLAKGEPRLRNLGERAREERQLALQRKDIRDQADRLFKLGERLRFSLLRFGGDPMASIQQVEKSLKVFAVFEDKKWMRRPSIGLLDATRRERLLAEVNELLFLWAVVLEQEHSDTAAMTSQALEICATALNFAASKDPWRAMQARCQAHLGHKLSSLPALSPGFLQQESTARDCFQWALLYDLDGRREETIAWLERAVRLEPGDYWSQFYLGYHHWKAGHNQKALEHDQAAVALQPGSPWAWFNLAFLHRAADDLDLAMDDLNQALKKARDFDFLEARLQLGLVKQWLGDSTGARAAYERVIARGAGSPIARAGRLNRAKLDMDEGAVGRAWAEYNALVGEDERDIEARLGRALVALQLGRYEQADKDLSILLTRDDPENAELYFARRALACLALGRLKQAESDAANSYRRKPTPSHQRLWVRTLLAVGRVEELSWLTEPDDLVLLPGDGPSLKADLRAAVKRLQPGDQDSTLNIALAHRLQSVLLSSLDDPEAEDHASRSIALAPQSATAYLVRARVRRRAGNRTGAMADVDSGLALEPGDPRLLELRGRLKSENGNPAAALIDFNRALARDAQGTVRAWRARALMALGQLDAAIRDWKLALDDDPDDPQLYLGRARAFSRLGRVDRALVDLEQAADWASNNPRLLTQIALAHAACLSRRPDQLARWFTHARRAWNAWTACAIRTR